MARQVGCLARALARMEHWLRQGGQAELTAADGGLLAERFARLGNNANAVAALAADLYQELRRS